MAAAIDEPLAVGPGKLDPETLHGSPEMTADDWESHGKAAVYANGNIKICSKQTVVTVHRESNGFGIPS